MGAMRTTPPTGTLSPPASHPTPRKNTRVARKLRETSLEVWAWEEIGTPCLHLCMQKTRTAQDLQGNTKPAPPQNPQNSTAQRTQWLHTENASDVLALAVITSMESRNSEDRADLKTRRCIGKTLEK